MKNLPSLSYTDEFTNINPYYSCLTNTYGLDYFDWINEWIKLILYPKPDTSKHQIKELNKKVRTRIFTITNKKLNIKICVCELQPKQKYDKVLIFSHGNGCDMYTFYDYLKLLVDNLNIMVVSYDYPTYGLSEGELNETTNTQALDDVISYYLKLTNKILLVGQSLGTGVVIDYVSKKKWTNPIILISPYKSIPKVITEFGLFEGLVSKHKYASYQKISNCICKIKIFHGKSDKLIDIYHSIELYNLAPNTFIPSWFDNTGHNDILAKIDYNEYKKILIFI
jgi:predicted esterase